MMFYAPIQQKITTIDIKATSWALFLGGIALHACYLVTLGYLLPWEQWNWLSGDTGSYVRPAKAFLETGTFAVHGEPDYHRTIGYPLFLAGVLKLAEVLQVEWRIVAYGIQAIVLACAYPAIYLLGRLLFRLRQSTAILCVLFSAVTGAFISYVPIILTDGLFATVLLTGIVCGLLALKKSSWTWACGHIVLITLAANIRPMLAFFPLAAVFFHLAWLKSHQHDNMRKTDGTTLVIIMLITTMLGVQSPALRNWLNHGVFTPSDIGSINLFDYVALEVLKHKGDVERYKLVNNKLKSIEEAVYLEERIEIRKREAFKVFREAPIETGSLLFYYTVLNSIETHWQNFFYLFKTTWYRDYDDGSVKWSPLPFMVAIIFIVVHGNIYIVTATSLCYLRKNYMLLAALFFYLIPYAFCGTSYQGSRFRLWLDPLLYLYSFYVLQRIGEVLSKSQLKAVFK
jgi:hypothetical protein